MNIVAQIKPIATRLLNAEGKDFDFIGGVDGIQIFSVPPEQDSCSFVGGVFDQMKELEENLSICEGEKIVFVNPSQTFGVQEFAELIIAHEVLHHKCGHFDNTVEYITAEVSNPESRFEVEVDRETVSLYGKKLVIDYFNGVLTAVNAALNAEQIDNDVKELIGKAIKQINYRVGILKQAA